MNQDPSLLAAEAASMSLFSPARIIRLELTGSGDDSVPAVEALLAADTVINPVIATGASVTAKSKLVKLVEGSNHAVAAICYQPDRRALVGIAMSAAEEQGLRLGNAEAQLLVDLVSGDQALMRRENIPVLDATSKSVEELATTIMQQAKLERRILERRVPGLSETLNRELVAFIQAVRQMDLKKQPSVSETIDWAKTLLLLHAEHLSLDMVKGTLSVFLKFEQDIASASEQLPALLQQARKDAESPRASHA